MNKEEIIEKSNYVTRSTAAEVFYSLSDKKINKSDLSFKDVFPGDIHFDAIRWALDSGVMSGYPDGTFKPEDYITTEEFVNDFYLFAQNSGIDTTCGDSLVNYNGFTDISVQTSNAYSWAIENGIYNPIDMDLHAKDFVTKEEFSKIVKNYDIKYGIHSKDFDIDKRIGKTNEEKLEIIIKNAKICAKNKLPYIDPNIAVPNVSLEQNLGADSAGFIKALYDIQEINIDGSMEALRTNGIEVPGARNLLNTREFDVAKKTLRPGDIIICNNGGHAVMYLGDGNIVHESYTEKCAVIKDLKDLEYMPGIVAVRRII